MNIFKAVEIYKRIPGLPSSQNPLRVIRGLWVSGVHLDNITMDATLQVTGETSNHCEERAYTDSHVDIHTDGNVNVINFQSGSFTVEQYTTQNADAYTDGNVNVIEFIDSDFTIADGTTPKQFRTLPENTGQNPAEPTLLIELFTSTALEWQ